MTKSNYKYFKLIFAFSVSTLSACSLLKLQDSNSAESKDAEASQAVADVLKLPVTPTHQESLTVPSADTLLSLLVYSRYINELDEQQLAKEYKKVNNAFFTRPSERTRLKLAMLLSKPDAEFHDDLQAQNMLHDYISEAQHPTPVLIEYAQLLLHTLKAREKEKEKYHLLSKELEKERTLRLNLETKLEALKSIETSITQRKNGSDSE